MNRSALLTRILALLVFAAVLAHLELVRMVVADPFSLLALVATGYLALSIAAIGGLVILRSWGFYVLYALVVYGTILLSISFVPLIPRLLPPEQQWIALTIENGAVLILGGITHWTGRGRTGRPAHPSVGPA